MSDTQNITGTNADRLPGFARNEQLGAGKLNRWVDKTNQNSQQLRPPSQVMPPKSSAGAVVQMFSIRYVYSDYLWCFTWDGENRGEEGIAVLKPWLLRESPFDNGVERLGITYEYSGFPQLQTRVATRTSDSETEDQIVVPFYRAHLNADEADIIFAISGVLGGLDDDVQAAAAEATWLDLNTDGRMWAKATT